MWLTENTSLAESTILKYANAIETISKELIEYNVIDGSLYNIIDPIVLETLKLKYLSIPKFIVKDTRGNRMYSNALNHYKNYLNSL